MNEYEKENDAVIKKDDTEELYKIAEKALENAKNEKACKNALRIFEQIPDCKDLDEKRKQCEEKIEMLKAGHKSAKKKKKQNIKLLSIITAACVLLAIISAVVFLPMYHRHNGQKKYSRAFSYATVGSTVLFGSYEQDTHISNGKEKIDWIVLAKEDDKALVISKYAIDTMKYNEIRKDNMTWHSSSLRKWLNGDFYDKAFDDDEKTMIVSEKVQDDAPSGIDPLHTLNDKIFILSVSEVKKYFKEDKDRMCACTEYCLKNGVNVAENGNCWWWLRSQGENSASAASVYNYGGIDERGYYVNNTGGGIRPAMWVRIKR